MSSIIPLNYNLPPLGGVRVDTSVVPAADLDVKSKSFTDYLMEAVDNIENLEAVKQNDSYLLAIGELDDIAAMQINSQKAEIAVQLMVQMRNRLTDAYSEIMRMSI